MPIAELSRGYFRDLVEYFNLPIYQVDDRRRSNHGDILTDNRFLYDLDGEELFQNERQLSNYFVEGEINGGDNGIWMWARSRTIRIHKHTFDLVLAVRHNIYAKHPAAILKIKAIELTPPKDHWVLPAEDMIMWLKMLHHTPPDGLSGYGFSWNYLEDPDFVKKILETISRYSVIDYTKYELGGRYISDLKNKKYLKKRDYDVIDNWEKHDS